MESLMARYHIRDSLTELATSSHNKAELRNLPRLLGSRDTVITTTKDKNWEADREALAD